MARRVISNRQKLEEQDVTPAMRKKVKELFAKDWSIRAVASELNTDQDSIKACFADEMEAGYKELSARAMSKIWYHIEQKESLDALKFWLGRKGSKINNFDWSEQKAPEFVEELKEVVRNVLTPNLNFEEWKQLYKDAEGRYKPDKSDKSDKSNKTKTEPEKK